VSDDTDFFEKWVRATLTPLENAHWLHKQRMAAYQASLGANGSTILVDTPAHMQAQIIRLSEINYAFILGDAFHIATLEPDRFDMEHGEEEFFQYSVTKTLDTKANEGAFAADPSRPIVTPALIDKARRMRDAVFKNDLAKHLLSPPAEKELSGYAWDEEAKCVKKIRIDFMPKKGNYICDLKSTPSVHEGAFWSSVMKYRYAAKSAYYMDVAAEINNTRTADLFYLIAVEGPKGENQNPTSAPYLCRVFEIASPVKELSLIEEGRAFYRNRLAMFANAARENCWEGYEHESEPYVLTTFRPRSFFKSKQPAEDDDS
jgi:hypothetical protein